MSLAMLPEARRARWKPDGVGPERRALLIGIAYSEATGDLEALLLYNGEILIVDPSNLRVSRIPSDPS